MGQWIAVAMPVLPGQSDRVRNFAAEVGEHQAEFERLNKEATVTRFAVWHQETPTGDFALFGMEVDDPTRLRQSFTDSDYDRWWLGYLKEVTGLDLLAMPEVPQPPPIVYDWQG